MKNNIISKIVLAGALIFLAAGCNSKTPETLGKKNSDVISPTPIEAMKPTPTPTVVIASPTPLQPTAIQNSEKIFTVTGTNFAFVPAEIKVKKGDKIKIILKNDAGFHNLLIDKFNVKTANIGAGKTDTIEFIADQAGSFEYYCGIGNHRAMGMKGNLIVQ